MSWESSKKLTKADLDNAIEQAQNGNVEVSAPFSDGVMVLLFAIARAYPDVSNELIAATRLAFEQDTKDFQ